MLTLTDTIEYTYGQTIHLDQTFPDVKKATVVLTVIPDNDLVEQYRNEYPYKQRRDSFHQQEEYLNSFVNFPGKQ